MNRARHAALIALLAAGLAVPLAVDAPAQAADAPPPPVTAVTAKGTPNPSEVVISWRRPTDPAYAGARVVVLAGTRAATHPYDPAAVLAANVSSTAASFTWSTGAAGLAYTVSVFAYNSTGTAFALPAKARADLPGTVRHLVIANDGYHYNAYFAVAVAAASDGAILCEHPDRPPATPRDARECSTADSRSPQLRFSSDAKPGFFSVFATDSATGALGPAVSDGDGEKPAMAPDWSYDENVNSTTLDLTWLHRRTTAGGIDYGANTSWELLYAAGETSPVGNPAAHRMSIPVAGARDYRGSEQEYQEYRQRVGGLVPEAPYTFAIRGVSANGETSTWQTLTTSARARGHYVARSGAGGSATTTLLKPAFPYRFQSSQLLVEPNGTEHVITDEFASRSQNLLPSHRVVSNGVVRTGTLPGGMRSGPLEQIFVTMGASRSSSGVIAVTDGFCVYVLVGAAPWRNVGCTQQNFTSPEDQRLNSHWVEVRGIEIDRRNAVHVIWSEGVAGASVLRYASDASGKWVVRDVSKLAAGGQTHLSYDPVTDNLVLITSGTYANNTRYQWRVATKPARALGFDPVVTAFDTVAARTVVPTRLVSCGGRITVVGLRLNVAKNTAWGTPVLLTGTSARSIGGMTSIPGISAYTSVWLDAQSASRVTIAWTNRGFGPKQGIWTAVREYTATGTLLGKPVRLTRSVYDDIEAFDVDGAGRAHMTFQRN